VALSGCLLLPQRAMHALLQAHPELWRHIAEIAFDDMNAAVTGCADILQNDALKRLAAVLLWLTGTRHRDRPDLETASVALTQSELAQLLNLSRSGLAPLLDQLQQHGCIRKHYGAIRITDCTSLRQIAGA
jgi:CRP-like cAMP-binding protein